MWSDLVAKRAWALTAVDSTNLVRTGRFEARLHAGRPGRPGVEGLQHPHHGRVATTADPARIARVPARC